VLEGSYDGITTHQVLNAGLTMDGASSNVLTDKGIPYVRVRITAHTSGDLGTVFLVAHE
jgi:hypothetical protein